jgi:hypothetical protein
VGPGRGIRGRLWGRPGGGPTQAVPQPPTRPGVRGPTHEGPWAVVGFVTAGRGRCPGCERKGRERGRLGRVCVGVEGVGVAGGAQLRS